jgi:hypothetical protein
VTLEKRAGKFQVKSGEALSATSDGSVLILHWPYHAPVASVKSTFAMQCAPGPRKTACERSKTEEANFAYQDQKFFERARFHPLPLKEAQLQPNEDDKVAAGYLSRLHCQYYITRVK